MAKKYVAGDSTKAAFRELRHLGLIPSDWRVSQLTEYKGKRIRALAKEYKRVIEQPKAFSVRSVQKKTADAMIKAGYQVIKTDKNKYRVILKAAGVEKQFIRNGKLVIHRQRRIETVYLTGGIEMLQKLAETIDNEKLKDNEYWTLKIGGNFTVLEQSFQSIEDAIEYYYLVEAYLTGQQKRHLQLVKVQFTD